MGMLCRIVVLGNVESFHGSPRLLGDILERATVIWQAVGHIDVGCEVVEEHVKVSAAHSDVVGGGAQAVHTKPVHGHGFGVWVVASG